MSRTAINAPDGRVLYSTAPGQTGLFSKGAMSPLKLQKSKTTPIKASVKPIDVAKPSSAASSQRTTPSNASTQRTTSSNSTTSRSSASAASSSSSSHAALPTMDKAATAGAGAQPQSPSKKKAKAKRAKTDRSASPSLRKRTEMASLKERMKAADKLTESLANSPPEERKPATSKIAELFGSAMQQAKEEKAERARQRKAEEAEKAAAWLEEWKKWVAKINLADVVLDALQMPRDKGEATAFDYMRGLDRRAVEGLLGAADLGGLVNHVMGGIELLQGQAYAARLASNQRAALRSPLYSLLSTRLTLEPLCASSSVTLICFPRLRTALTPPILPPLCTIAVAGRRADRRSPKSFSKRVSSRWVTAT